LESNQGKCEVIVVNQEVLNKEAWAKTFGAPKDQSVDQKLAVGSATHGEGASSLTYKEPLKFQKRQFMRP
jgi:hypothetical protein